MLSWEIFGDDLLWMEIYAGIALLLGVAAWVFVSKIPISIFALLTASVVLAAGAFRPIDYNSDTENYFSYVYFLRFVQSSDIFFLTKLEPVHSALILLLRDFRLWLIAEAVIMIFGLVLCYRTKPSPQSFLILCAFVLTLSTSSLRYCSAIVYFYYFVARKDMKLADAARATAILSCFHISMLLSGAMALQKRFAPFAVTALCIAIFFQSSLFLGWRVEIDYAEASTGLKTLVVVLIPIIYLMFRQPIGKSTFLLLYLVSLLSIFVVTSTVLFTFNRFLILGALVVLISQWQKVRASEDDVFDRGVILLIACAIIVPYIVSLPTLYYSGEW